MAGETATAADVRILLECILVCFENDISSFNLNF